MVLLYDTPILVLWLIVALCFMTCEAGPNLQVEVGSGKVTYPGQVALFGNQVPFANNLNLMLPPHNETHLCNSLDGPLEGEDDSGLSRQNMSVALLVSYGECLPSKKVEMALNLRHKNYSHYGMVSHLILYHTDEGYMDALFTLNSNNVTEEFKHISLVFVSTRSGQEFLEAIEQEGKRLRIASAQFGAPGNEFWYMPVSFVERVREYSSINDKNNGTVDGGDPLNEEHAEDTPPTTSGARDIRASWFPWIFFLFFFQSLARHN